MTVTTLGDLTTHVMLLRHNTRLRTEMQRLSVELASGQVADPARHLGGDFTALADIEHRMTANAAYRQATADAKTATDAMQHVLGSLQDVTQDLAGTLVTVSETGLGESGQIASGKARAVFDQAVALLNTRVAGRSLFAGEEVTAPALADPDAILAGLRSATAGLTDPDDITTAVDGWFDLPGGGFGTIAYTGTADAAPAFRVAEGESARLDLRADHAALRASLKPIALALLAGDQAAGLDQAARDGLYRAAGTALYAAQDGLGALQADLGVTQARLEETAVRNASEKLALEQARAGLLSVDPYETATRLEQVQFNLESLYTVTVRLSRLSLTEYM
ncbi:flagellar hook-associated protein 3 FlgL [Lutimaribacter pacificus]|uniref:Flagellar hook-associated protein 3 FlgL n=1 Tax=Lutimaribacter pacificus TaxID=391948 RepID=A0A1H0EEU2_9RHOB|nr:flagellin [Lutimaribacter pacificus]SDN80955.1 flagellar hook-associated protein 3 FlgL [Lutimaribacter pacificus]SHK53685.1 flagellar hook-associated protein 3 FlgL [Lutimaribacter pacificus]